MFYSNQILNQKGPLAMVWLAAHMDNKLHKKKVFQANLLGSIDSILDPEVPLALRLSGQLLLGVVNIYKKKVLYLFEDCNDAISKMQQAFKPGAPLLQNGGKAAPMQITITDNSLLDAMNGLDDEFQYASFDLSQPLDFGLQSRGSLMLAEDGAALFTTPISYNDEQFDVDEEELERTLSMGSAERLRDADVAPMQSLMDVPEAYDSPRKADEMLPDIPADSQLLVTKGAPPLPSPPASSRRDSDLGSLGIGHLDNFLDGHQSQPPRLELEDEPERDSGGKEAPRPARLRSMASGKRKRAVRDVDANGQPATVISTSQIRGLMADRAPLLKAQKRLDQASIRNTAAGMLQAHQRQADGDAWLAHPAISLRLAPSLQALFQKSCQLEQQAQRPEDISDEGGEEEPNKAGRNEAGMAALRLEPASHEGQADVAEASDSQGMGAIQQGPDAEFDNSMPYEPFEADEPLTAPPSSASKRQSTHRRSSLGSHGQSAGPQTTPSQQTEVSSRTEALLEQVKMQLTAGPNRKASAASTVPFSGLHSGKSRSEASQLFFELLVLQARKRVILSQESPFADIAVALPES